MGESAQFNLVPMSIAAITQVLSWNAGDIQKSIRTLTAIVRRYKRDFGIYSNDIPYADHIVSFPLDGLDIASVKARLKSKNVIVSFRGNTIRVSPHVYNTEGDMARFLECI
jgi:selenocysteine lyase/cysteine desulfurase